MSGNSSIEWTNATWNPIRGCSMISAGCKNCYAMKQAHRQSGAGRAYEGLTELGPDGPRWTGKVRLVPALLEEPLYWKRPRRIFVNSMSDLFHEDVPFEFIFSVFNTMAICAWHTFQILTKRPHRMREWFTWLAGENRNHQPVRQMQLSEEWPIPNVWLGVSVEDQKTADERIPLLVQTPAAIRFVSYEPALGPINWGAIPSPGCYLDGFPDGLHWVIGGSESGPHARKYETEWFEGENCTGQDVITML